jgi:hypothetical protein
MIARHFLTAGLLVLTGCPDRGLEPKEYCAEAVSSPAPGACSVTYSACSDSFACDFTVACTAGADGGAPSCRCTAAANCHLDTTFQAPADFCTDPSHRRSSLVAGCQLGADTTFSRVR